MGGAFADDADSPGISRESRIPAGFLDDSYRFVAVDVETAIGQNSSICQIGLAGVRSDGRIDTVSFYVDPQQRFSAFNTQLHGIDAKVVRGAPTFVEILGDVRPFLEQNILVQHSQFDKTAFRMACECYGCRPLEADWLDSVKIARKAWPEFRGDGGGHGLKNLKKKLRLKFDHHDAGEDARAAAEVTLLAEARTGKPFGELANFKKKKYSERTKFEGAKDGALSGQNACFSGKLQMPREEAAHLAASVGISVKQSVTKQINLLVLGEQDLSTLAGHAKSSKHRKAEELIASGQDIRIIGENEFLDLVKCAK